jgi:hypothetical protein
MAHVQNTKEGVVGPILVMFLAVMTGAWFVYSTLFPQGVLTFIILLIYLPVVGIIAVILYRYLKCRDKASRAF